MGSTVEIGAQAGAAPPPPAGPPVVDPSAPGLSPECFGIEAPPKPAIETGDGPPLARMTTGLPSALAAPRRATIERKAPEHAGGDAVKRAFVTDLDVCEIDDRGRPGAVWTAKARELSRGELVFYSRRMCYPGRHKLVLIHLIDNSPVAVYGVVEASEYEGEGQYRVELELRPMPTTNRHIAEWIETRRARGRRA